MIYSLFTSWLRQALGRQAVRQAASALGARPTATASGANDTSCEQVADAEVLAALVFALPIEAAGVTDRMAGRVELKGHCFVTYQGRFAEKPIVVAISGAGGEAAARATRAIIDGHRPAWVVSAGFAGSLQESIVSPDIVVADSLVDPSGRKLTVDASYTAPETAPGKQVVTGRILTVDRIARTPQEKRRLAGDYGALAVDMESYAVALQAKECGKRFLAIRVISDDLDDRLPADVDRLMRAEGLAARAGALAGTVWRRPGSVRDLWQLRESALAAGDRLAQFLEQVLPDLPR